MDHSWPTGAAEHLWGRWMTHTPRKGIQPATQYRQCAHPDCTAFETREAPTG